MHDILVQARPLKKPANLPYRSIGVLFKGREVTLADLCRSFGSVPDADAAPVVAGVVNGLGGVGKTRLAVEYAWRRASDYAAILFVCADSPEALQRNLAALCARAVLNLPEQREPDEGKQRDAVVAWLRKHPGWLLILDNIDADDAAAAAEVLLPQLSGGHVLLTSRLANWGSGVSTQRLDELTPDAAADFLLTRTDGKRHAQDDDSAAARTLAEELGYLALALELAGACIAQRRLSFTGYLDAWQAQRHNVLGWFDPRLRCLAITLQVSFNQAGEPALRLLQRLAWLAPEPIPVSLMQVPVPAVAASAADTFDALIELESYSLITRAADSASLSVHRLVHQIAQRNQRDDPTQAVLAESLRWIDRAFVGDPQDVGAWPVLEPLAMHARLVSTHADAAGLTDPTARLLNRVGTLLASKALYAEAAPRYALALAIRERSLGPTHPNVATSLNNLAELYRSQGAYAQAEPLYERALAIWEAALGPAHPYVALSLHNLALLYKNQGAYAKAKPLWERVLAIREQTLGPAHPDVAASLNNLALLYNDQGAYAKAEPLHVRVLAIREQALGPSHPDVAQSLNDLAGLYQNQGAYAKAEPLMRQAVVSFVGALGADHPRSRIAAENYAGLLQLMAGTHDGSKLKPSIPTTPDGDQAI